MLCGTRDHIAIDVAAAGQNQTVVATQTDFTAVIFPADLFGGGKNLFNGTAQEFNARHIEQRLQRSNQRLHGAFIKTWTHAQLGLWRNHRNINGLLVNFRQARGAQGCPHTGKASTDDQNLFTHCFFSLVTTIC